MGWIDKKNQYKYGILEEKTGTSTVFWGKISVLVTYKG
jgi:hypothetical protein